MQQYEKENNQLKVIKTISTISESLFTRESLLIQKQSIIDRKNSDNNLRDAEIDEIDEMLIQCDSLEIE